MNIFNKKNTYFIISIIFFGLSSVAWGMASEPEEFRIPRVTLHNGVHWEHDISSQNGGTCCSHAVTECLKYIHARARILPYYLHKNAHHLLGTTKQRSGVPHYAYQDYETGHSIVDLMNFSSHYGVPEIPEGQTFQPNSGLSFPRGTTKYAFEHICNVYTHEQGTNSEKIKQSLRKHNLPIVFDVMSRRGRERLFTDNTSLVPAHLQELESALPEVKPKEKTFYHAVVAYGYSDRENGILIKNSWGTSYLSQGKAVLSYDYLDNYGHAAYFGFGRKFISEDYSEAFGSGMGPRSRSKDRESDRRQVRCLLQ